MSPRERLKCRPQLIMLRSSQIFFIKLLSFIPSPPPIDFFFVQVRPPTLLKDHLQSAFLLSDDVCLPHQQK